MSAEGHGAGAALTIDFLTLAKGAPLLQGITLAGTLAATGQITRFARSG